MNQTTWRAGAELTKKNVIVVDDSQLQNIDGAKLSNEHYNVTVKPMPGARRGFSGGPGGPWPVKVHEFSQKPLYFIDKRVSFKTLLPKATHK